jgi:hypothetical protein
VKDDSNWSSLKGLKSGFVFMLIGQAGPLPTAPAVKTIFVEDVRSNKSKNNNLFFVMFF